MGISGVYRARDTAKYREGRTVYRSAEVPHLWAHGLPDGKRIRASGANMYAVGDTIYSYGEHFPMARRLVVASTTGALRNEEVVYLVNPGTYSATTGGHQSAVRRSIPDGAKVYNIPPRGPDGSHHLWDILAARGRKSARPLVAYYLAAIESAARAASKPRIRPHTRAAHIARMDALVAEWREVRRLFSLRIREDAVDAPDGGNMDAIRERVAREESAARAERKRVEARERRRTAEAQRKALALVDEWRTGRINTYDSRDGVTIRHVGYPILRIDPATNEVVTSMGARVPVDEARKVLRILPRLVNRLGEVDTTVEVGHYRGMRATSSGLVIGCHAIPWVEVRAFADYAGWPLPDILPTGE